MSNFAADPSTPAPTRAPMRVLRAGQVVATIGEIAISAYLAYQVLAPHQYCVFNSFTNSYDCVDTAGGVYGGTGAFLLFNCVWNILSLLVIFVGPRFSKHALNPLVILLVDAIAMFFWWIGAISWAADTGTYSVVADIVTILAFVNAVLFLATFVANLRVWLRARAASKATTKGLDASSGSPVVSAPYDNFGKPPATAYYQQRPDIVHQV